MGGAWELSQKITAKNEDGTNDYKLGSLYGATVALGDDVLAVGDQGSFKGYTSNVYVYGLENGGAEIQKKVEAYATDMTINQGRLQLGLYWQSKALTFRNYGKDWILEYSITQPTLSDSDFGLSVGLMGDDVLVGSPSSASCPNISENAACGSVYAYNAKTPINKRISVTKSLGGSIKSSPIGIDCGSVCEADFYIGSEVNFVAAPENGYVFSKWQGDCVDLQECKVIVNADTSIAAIFKPKPQMPNPIPTLNEWAKFIMIFAILGIVGWHVRQTHMS
jgi:Divergent InlB B-repeat domain